MSFCSRAAVVICFAIAMAYLESAVVVYLQRALGITADQLFPLRGPEVVGDLAAIEGGREAATMLMLAGVGVLAGRRWTDRLAWMAVAFGVWDVFYYAWLWVFEGWPPGPGTWDVLFLIPVPWTGPVWAPVAVSVALIAFGLAVGARAVSGPPLRIGPSDLLLGVGGGVGVVLSFTLDAGRIMDGGLPGWFPWPIFWAGMVLAMLGATMALRRRADGSAAE
jgi:hypothetical protein